MAEVIFHRAASTTDVLEGEPLAAYAGSMPIVIYRIGDAVYATASQCTHAHVSLVDGYVDGNVIECPMHGGKFDIRTGKAVHPPCTTDLKTYEVKIEANDIFVRTDVRDAEATA
jgi:nitrite reductase/ring-hydroxylating ferredoxin subunit